MWWDDLFFSGRTLVVFPHHFFAFLTTVWFFFYQAKDCEATRLLCEARHHNLFIQSFSTKGLFSVCCDADFTCIPIHSTWATPITPSYSLLVTCPLSSNLLSVTPASSHTHIGTHALHSLPHSSPHNYFIHLPTLRRIHTCHTSYKQNIHIHNGTHPYQ